jgi:hypothetical protein
VEAWGASKANANGQRNYLSSHPRRLILKAIAPALTANRSARAMEAAIERLERVATRLEAVQVRPPAARDRFASRRRRRRRRAAACVRP